MDIDPRLRPGHEDVRKSSNNISLPNRDINSKPDRDRHLPSYTRGSPPNPSQPDQGLRHSNFKGDYFSHISPESSNEQLHGSTPSSTSNALAIEGPLGEYLNEMSMGIQHDDHDHDPNDPLADLKRPRACEACRQLKVRCEPHNDDPAGSCKRCAKAKRRCVVTAPTRKRQKKTDSRVSELEKKIDALTASLQASRRSDGPGNDRAQNQDTVASRQWLGGGKPPQAPSAVSVSPTVGTKRTFDGDTKFPPPPSQVSQSGFFTGASRSPPGTAPSIWQNSAATLPPGDGAVDKTNEVMDIIDRGLVDVQTASDIFDHYVKEVAPTLPVVVFPPNTSMAMVRHDKPILFHTIMTLSIGVFRPDLQMSLVQEVHRIFADRVVVKGEKSLELVQSIMLACIWYSPPDQFEELKFFQFIHLAVVMALDIGMGRVTRRRGNKQQGLLREFMGKSAKRTALDADAPETRRIWLGAYFMAVNASMALRRPLLCRWHPYMDECIDILQTSPDAQPSDKILIHWAKLSHIAEEIGFQFSMDDPNSNLSMNDTKVQYGLKGFERQLDEWRQEISSEDYTPVLRHAENVVNIYMHEISMHNDHNIDDFSPPFNASIKNDFKFEKATAAQIDALTACLASIHTALDCMLVIEPADLICLPTVFYARTAYAFIALLKIFSAVSSDKGLARVFSIADLKLEDYFEKMTDHFIFSSRRPGGRTASRFSLVLNLLRNWFNNRKTEQSGIKSEKASGSLGSETVQNPVQHLTKPSGSDSRSNQISPLTTAVSNAQPWPPYNVHSSEAAASNPFEYQFGQDSEQQSGTPALAGMVPTTSQTEYGGLMPNMEFPMPIPMDTAALFSMGDMLPDDFFNLPFDGNGNLYIS